MKNFKDFSLLEKIVVGIIVAMLTTFMPEIMIILDFSGIELTISFLLIYYKSTISWFQHKIEYVRDFLITAKKSIFNKHVIQPKIYLTYSVCSLCLLLISGSLAFSLSVFLVDGIFI